MTCGEHKAKLRQPDPAWPAPTGAGTGTGSGAGPVAAYVQITRVEKYLFYICLYIYMPL